MTGGKDAATMEAACGAMKAFQCQVTDMLEIVIEEEGRESRTVPVAGLPCRIGRGKEAEVQLGGWRSATRPITTRSCTAASSKARSWTH